MLSPRAGAALGVLIVLVAVLAIPFKEWVTQRARIADLEGQLAWHHQRVAELEAARARWSDPAYVEAQARERLRFVRVGEVGYVVLTEDEDAVPEDTSTGSLASVPKGGPWWSAVWGTVAKAADPAGTVLAPEPAEPAPSYAE